MLCLPAHLDLIEQHLEALLEPFKTEASLWQAARYAVFSKGKRLRPQLVLAAVDAFGVPPGPAINPACAIELIHTYSMIHDDLPCMDNDDFRRGLPTLHKAFDESTALLAGDFLLTLAFEVLSHSPDLHNDQKLELIRILSKSAGGAGMVGGQQKDLEAGESTFSRASLEEIHDKKTGALIAACFEFGGVIAGANAKMLSNLKEAGKTLGLAYQVMDDIIDETNSFAKHGKQMSSDRANGKCTFVTLLGLEKAKEEAEALLSRALFLIQQLPSPEVLIRLSKKLVQRTI